MAQIRAQLSPELGAVAVTIEGDGQSPATILLTAHEVWQLIRGLESGLGLIEHRPGRLVLPGGSRRG